MIWYIRYKNYAGEFASEKEDEDVKILVDFKRVFNDDAIKERQCVADVIDRYWKNQMKKST